MCWTRRCFGREDLTEEFSGLAGHQRPERDIEHPCQRKAIGGRCHPGFDCRKNAWIFRRRFAEFDERGGHIGSQRRKKKVSQFDLIRSIEKVLLGPERKSHLLTVEEKKIASYHEAGHALVSSVLKHADPVHKVSVVSRGRAAGIPLKLPLEEKHLYSKAHFLDEISVALGGYLAEKMIFGDITTGASDDLRHAMEIARALVMKYGMSETIGPVAWEARASRYSWARILWRKKLFGRSGQRNRH